MENRAKTLKSSLHGIAYIVTIFDELWSTKRLKLDRNFYQPLISVLSPIHRTGSKRINVAPTANLNETALGLSAAQIRSPKKF